MSEQNNTTKLSYNHLSVIEKGKIEVLHKQGKSQSEIARALGRNRSTISRELKRETVTQMKRVYNAHLVVKLQNKQNRHHKILISWDFIVSIFILQLGSIPDSYVFCCTSFYNSATIHDWYNNGNFKILIFLHILPIFLFTNNFLELML